MADDSPGERGWLAWVGLVAGFGLGLFDLALLLALGARLDLGGIDVTVPVMLFYGATFGALGYAIGRLLLARRRARVDAHTIGSQLEELRASQAQVVEYERLASIGQMAAGVAHEVRNPLGVIRSSAALVEEGLPAADAELRRVCAFIAEEVDRLDAFVTKILDFSRPLRPDPEALAAATVVDSAVALAEAHVADRAVTREVPDVTLLGDRDLLVQALLGLLVNAGQATAPGGRIALRAVATGRDVHFEVADDGPGVPESDAERVFEPFVTTKARGTGLGLAMARRVARAHGGRLELAPLGGTGPGGRGACFRLTIPGSSARMSA